MTISASCTTKSMAVFCNNQFEQVHGFFLNLVAYLHMLINRKWCAHTKENDACDLNYVVYLGVAETLDCGLV